MFCDSGVFTKKNDCYKIHILIFILALFVAITVAHPSLFVNDEWVTVNQLAQLQEGHQVLINEGKYGTGDNGTLSQYFINKNNYLAYPLFLPLISLPALWLISGMGEFFVFAIVYLWTFLLIAIALVMNVFFREYTYVGKYRWTSGLIIAAFVLFFLNLLYYLPFPVSGTGSFPEVMAIVVTNILLFSLMPVMIFESIRTIFQDTLYAVFGTIVCISCSSYLFWANFCKDHLLVAFLFTAIVFAVIKFLYTQKIWSLCGAFFLTGLLAWARPELALLVFLALCIFIVYAYYFVYNGHSDNSRRIPLFGSLFLTLAGAVPFFVNNYLFTRNILLPVAVLWNSDTASSTTAIAGSAPGQQTALNTLAPLINVIQRGTALHPSTFFSDLYGILFNPQSGSIGVFVVVPLFLISLFLVPLLTMLKTVQYSRMEKQVLVAMTLMSFGVFLAYIRGLSGMNVSAGILPDIRYLSPIYLPLNIIGLVVLRNVTSLSENPLDLIKGMLISWFIIAPISLVAVAWGYPTPELGTDIFTLLNAVVSITIFILIAFCLVCILGNKIFKMPEICAKIVLIFLCSIPLIWQIDASFLARLWGTGLGGYSFLIPVVRMFFGKVF